MNYSYGTESGITTLIECGVFYWRKNKFTGFEAKIDVNAFFPFKRAVGKQ
jgi:hypothetical protein